MMAAGRRGMTVGGGGHGADAAPADRARERGAAPGQSADDA
jgi:hypothetical protein